MNTLICLKEIAEPHVFHSTLTVSKKSRYCVLAENSFIIFEKSTDVISLFRVPLNYNTKLELQEQEFKISYHDFSFSFCCQDNSFIQKWSAFLKEAIQKNYIENITEFYSEVVHIDKIKSVECPIIISKSDCRLFVYESYKHQISDISCHIINLIYYNIEINESRSSSIIGNTLIINGPYAKFRLTFQSSELALEWKAILRSAVLNYWNLLHEKDTVTEIYKNESNKFCADCGACDPTWVSINICVTLCLNCVAQHRDLGTRISRTQSMTLDETCWSDSLLVRLFKEIGNDSVNKFVCKNIPTDVLSTENVNIERKYKMKEFIDCSYLCLSLEEIVTKLKETVKTSNVAETMRLWFSNKTDFNRETVDKLLECAKDSRQILQEKFISLQSNITEENEESASPIFEGVFHLSYNDNDKLHNLFLLCIYNDRIEIKVENPDIFVKDYVNICTVYLNSINMICCDASKESLQISIYPCCKFLLINKERMRVGGVNLANLRIFDSSLTSLAKLKRLLFDHLLPNHFEPSTDETSLFLYTDVQINKEGIVRCKCHLTHHEIILWSPINIKYDLTRTEELKVADDKMSIVICITHCDIYLRTGSSTPTILGCLNEASKIPIISFKDENTIVKLEELIKFIKFSGYSYEGVFRIYGKSEKVESLLIELVKSKSNFTISSDKYSVHDVTSCLKKCLFYIGEPLIPEEIILLLTEASLLEITEKLKCYTDALQSLPDTNFRMLRQLFELLFIIYQVSKRSNFVIDDISPHVSIPFITTKQANLSASNDILHFLIENFFQLFQYSSIDQNFLLLFLKNLNITTKSIMRTFHIELCLNHLLISNNLMLLEHTSNDILCDFNSCIAITPRIDGFKTVKELYDSVFTGSPYLIVDLWQFIIVNNKIFKRLIYLHEEIDNVILKPSPHLSTHRSHKKSECLVFMHIDRVIASDNVGTVYQCRVKVCGVKNYTIELICNSINIYNNETSIVCHHFTLSDIGLYRSHRPQSYSIFIVHGDSEVCCKFGSRLEFEEFLIYFDKFRLRNLQSSN